eukprot:TRINITY_DN91450_c0_g1_i1.p1 TRINITY_DN91450_c0_g1~~TRINITY_DN91450_c0_g1_i1.p1  ORF type:complete len:526 (+),score=136.60 TRINITY_DN91450_c0_g1_i1:37-1578(+)
MQPLDRSRSPHGHGPFGAGGFANGAAARPPVPQRPVLGAFFQHQLGQLQQQEAKQLEEQRMAQQQNRGLQPRVIPPTRPPAAQQPPEPPPKSAEQLEREANQRLREAVERNEGYFEATLGQKITGSEASAYTVVAKEALGVGVFSVVWPCADKNNKLVALKVIRHQDHFRKYAAREVEVLKRAAELSEQDAESAAHLALVRDTFVHKVSSPAGDREHLCMAFEKLESNLRSAGRQPLDKALQFSKQIMRALRFLHDLVGIVHCDVKPDNLLLRWDGLAVKLCDFGTARTSAEIQAQDELQPLFYRAPEVFLGCTRGRKIDVWSAALTIYELVVGRILFRNCHTPREVLQHTWEIRGPAPAEMRTQGRLSPAYFSSKGFHTEVGKIVDPDSYKKVSMMSELAPFADYGKEKKQTAQEQAKAQLSRLIGAATVVAGAMKRSGGPTESEKKLKQLADLLERCLEVNPANRITAAEACEHESLKAVELPPMVDLQEAPPLPEEAPPPLPPDAPPPPS